MRSLKLSAAAVIALGVCRVVSPQSASNQPINYGLGHTPTADEIRANDISISPSGKELPAGKGSAVEGAQIFAQKCSACHGETGTGALAPQLIKPAGSPPPDPSAPCAAPCIRGDGVIALHSPYATTLWDYINRGMPFGGEGSLKFDDVYALTAFLLYKNGVIPQDLVLDQKSLPQVKMPNRDGYTVAWQNGKPRPSAANP